MWNTIYSKWLCVRAGSASGRAFTTSIKCTKYQNRNFCTCFNFCFVAITHSNAVPVHSMRWCTSGTLQLLPTSIQDTAQVPIHSAQAIESPHSWLDSFRNSLMCVHHCTNKEHTTYTLFNGYESTPSHSSNPCAYRCADWPPFRYRSSSPSSLNGNNRNAVRSSRAIIKR